MFIVTSISALLEFIFSIFMEAVSICGGCAIRGSSIDSKAKSIKGSKPAESSGSAGADGGGVLQVEKTKKQKSAAAIIKTFVFKNTPWYIIVIMEASL